MPAGCCDPDGVFKVRLSTTALPAEALPEESDNDCAERLPANTTRPPTRVIRLRLAIKDMEVLKLFRAEVYQRTLS